MRERERRGGGGRGRKERKIEAVMCVSVRSTTMYPKMMLMKVNECIACMLAVCLLLIATPSQPENKDADPHVPDVTCADANTRKRLIGHSADLRPV